MSSTSALISRRRILQGSLAAPFVLGTRAASAATTNIKFSFSAPFDGSNASYFYADQQGWYRDAGLTCQFDASGGAGESVSRVGSGTYDLGIGDINVMAEFNSKNPASAIQCVYMLYFRSPLCVATLAKTGITKPSDLVGRKMGAAAADGAYRLFPAYSKLTNVDPTAITWNMVGLQLREALLSRGDVDAILGFDSTMYFGLLKTGLKGEDIKFLYYSDAGLDLYSNGIFVSRKMMTENPDAVKRFIAVTARAWQASIANPEAMIEALKIQAPLVNTQLELDKLRWVISHQLITDESKADGLGGIRPERLGKAIELVGKTYGFATIPKPEDLFNPAFMPSADVRKIPV